jgi:hypothetical protein
MRIVIAASIAASLLSPIASAKTTKCNVVGTWGDSYGVVATFTTDKKGTATATLVCATPFKLKSTTITSTTWDITGTNKKCSSVSPVYVALTFDTGSCTSATGTITIPGYGQLADAWTLTGAPARRTPAPRSDMLNGLK